MNPFIQVDGRWYVDVNWRPDRTELPYRISLRQLNNDEVEWLTPCLGEAIIECWARLFRDDDSIEHGAVLPDEID